MLGLHIIEVNCDLYHLLVVSTTIQIEVLKLLHKIGSKPLEGDEGDLNIVINSFKSGVEIELQDSRYYIKPYSLNCIMEFMMYKTYDS